MSRFAWGFPGLSTQNPKSQETAVHDFPTEPINSAILNRY